MPEITAAPATFAARVPRRTPAPAPARTPDRAPTPASPPAPAPTPAAPPAPAPGRAPAPPPPREPAATTVFTGAAGPCPTCAHPPCRARRSASQPRMYGRTPEYTAEHRTAAAVQARHRHAVVWFGESTQSYWAATPTGLIEAPDPDTLLLALTARPSRRPRTDSAAADKEAAGSR